MLPARLCKRCNELEFIELLKEHRGLCRDCALGLANECFAWGQISLPTILKFKSEMRKYTDAKPKPSTTVEPTRNVEDTEMDRKIDFGLLIKQIRSLKVAKDIHELK